MGKLMKCKSCGNDVAKTAKVCPHCGAKNKSGGGCSALFVLVVIVLVVIIAKAGREASNKVDEAKEKAKQMQAEEEKQERAKIAAMTPEQRAEYLKKQKRQQLANQFADKFERKFDGSIKPVVEFVKENMNNPKSFEHVATKWVIRSDAEGQYIVRMKYRGTNSFNAVVTDEIELIVDQDGRIILE